MAQSLWSVPTLISQHSRQMITSELTSHWVSTRNYWQSLVDQQKATGGRASRRAINQLKRAQDILTKLDSLPHD